MKMWLQRHPRSKRWFSLGAGLLLAIGFLAIWLRTVNLSDVIHHLATVNPLWLIAWACLDITAYGIRSQRWRLLVLDARRPAVSEALAICWCGRAAGILLPIRGGDLVRTVLAKRIDVPIANSMVATLLDKGFDLLPIAFGLALVPIVLGTSVLATMVERIHGPTALLVAASIVVLGLVVWFGRRVGLFQSRLLRPVTLKVYRVYDLFLPIGRLFLRSPSIGWGALGLTVLAATIDFASSIAMFYSVDSTISPLRLIIGGALFDVQFVLPAPPGQVGSYELAGQIIYAGILGIDASVVGAVMVIGHVLGNSLCAISGAVSISFLGGIQPEPAGAERAKEAAELVESTRTTA
ncbi:MAG TPA: lysylphosphatidylglycerol synthase transmembrane domain-containing protein [Chloroflexota bacterium]|nr:lysylphosphatidylglycerol synthase transmembrane domain-containing protein [Chloroflexota bacterium]